MIYSTLAAARESAKTANDARELAGQRSGKNRPLREISVVVRAETSDGFKVVSLGFANANELEIVK